MSKDISAMTTSTVRAESSESPDSAAVEIEIRAEDDDDLIDQLMASRITDREPFMSAEELWRALGID